MDAEEDFGGTVLTMNRPKVGIRELLATPTAPQAAPHFIPDEREAEWQPEPPPATAQPEPTDPLPRPNGAYKAHSRPANKPQATLYFVTKGHVFEGFSYAYLERIRLLPPDKPGGGLVLVLRFSGSVVTEVKVEGRNLHSLCNLIGLHLMPWVWEMPGRTDHRDEAASVVTKITVSEVGG